MLGPLAPGQLGPLGQALGTSPWRQSSLLAAYIDTLSPVFQNSTGTTPATASNDPVGYWGDLSGNGNHATQATSGNRPTLQLSIFNSLPTLRFVGASSQYLSLDAIATGLTGSDKPFSLIAVQRYTNAATGQIIFGLGNSASNTPIHQIDINASIYRASRRDDASSIVTVSGGTADTSIHVRSDIFTGTALSAWIDGTNIINAAALDVGTITLNTASIGLRRGLTLIAPISGDIPALFVYSSALSVSVRNSIERWLGARYNFSVS